MAKTPERVRPSICSTNVLGYAIANMKRNDHATVRTWVDIDTRAIRSNYRVLRSAIPRSVQLMGVVKSNAYGHNFTEFALELEKCGIDALAVDSILEALALRRAGVKSKILVLGYTLPQMVARAAGKNIELTISSMSHLRGFLKVASSRKVPIHIKVDTGMHRQGFMSNELPEVLKLLTGAKSKVRIAGLYTHFAEAKDPHDKAFTKRQIAEFTSWKQALTDAGFTFLAHAGATGGSLAFPSGHFGMVRVGAGMYGIWPSQETKKVFATKYPLKPVLSWKTIISEVKEIEKGEGVGYDRTFIAKKKTKIAVCPIGYWHGYPRLLSNNAYTLVHALRAPVVGRVSMDMVTIDVTNVPNAKEGDEVVLIGRSGKDEVFTEDLATRSQTTAYELLTRLNPLMKRIYR